MKNQTKMKREDSTVLRQFALIITFAVLGSLGLQAAEPEVKVFKTATCGCCGKWVEHLRANGFKVTVTDVPSTAEFRAKYGVPEKLASCHTGVVEGYALEGHVPAREIKKMLLNHPAGKGLAVPGMPAGSPGMEMGRVDAYEVLLFEAEGKTSVYGKYEAK